MLNLSMVDPDTVLRPRLSVVGVGGAGGNAINNMIRSRLEGCDFIAANTDSQALAMSLAPRKIQLGINLSRGLGAGSKPDIGRAAAEEQLIDILSLLEGSDMLFVTAGMGGGTGTGAAPVIARAARESGILTVGVVTKPFHFEGAHRMRQAEAGIAELQKYVDTLLVIPNQNLFRIANERTTFAEAFRMADEVLNSGVRGITDLMVMPGFMNLDFADVKTVMAEMGKAMMGTGEAEGENRAIRAAETAISNPLLDDISMKGARGVLINVTGGLDMTLFEMDQASNRIREEVDPDAQIKVGSTIDETLDGRIRVSVIATGIDAAMMAQQVQRRESASGSAGGTPPARTVNATAQKTETPVKTVAPAPAPAAIPAVTTTTPSVNIASAYFTMPQAITPQMVATQTTPATQRVSVAIEEPVTKPVVSPLVAKTEEPKPEQQPAVQARVESPSIMTATASPAVTTPPSTSAAASPPMASVVAPPLQAQTPMSPPPVVAATTTSTPTISSPLGSPLRQTSGTSPVGRVTPVGQSATTATPHDLRMSPMGHGHINQRSQSLFQRITGFGMVRPSATSRDMDDLETLSAKPTSARLGVDPSDRPALSTEGSDTLDIPAFLRRQTNH